MVSHIQLSRGDRDSTAQYSIIQYNGRDMDSKDDIQADRIQDEREYGVAKEVSSEESTDGKSCSADRHLDGRGRMDC